MFPEIRTLADVLPYVENRPDFAVKRGAGYVAIDYTFAGPETFAHPIQRECRGIKFAASGEIIARPFHKFHNIGEKPETQPHAIDWSAPHSILEKLDGSMIHPAEVDGEILWMTRAGVTDIAEKAGAFAVANGYVDRCRDLLRAGFTPIFEWLSPRNQIVVYHPADRLVLLAIRHTVTGTYGSWVASDWPDTVKGFDQSITDVERFVAETRALEDAEGYVVRFASGFMVKAKGDWYVSRHRARDSLLFEKNVLALILDGKEDDVLPFLPTEERAKLETYARAVRHGLTQSARALARIVAEGRDATGGDRKRFALEVVAERVPSLLKGPAFSVWLGTPAYEALKSVIVKRLGSAAGVEEIRHLVGNVVW